MDIVDKVAADIAEIPGNPSAREIARVAIEAYQRELWTPAFDQQTLQPELRRARTQRLVAYIMHHVGRHLCDHGENHGPRDASRDLFEALYEAGAEVVTDADRAAAGLPPRDQYGLTREELVLLEQRRLDAMRAPLWQPGPDASGSYSSWSGGAYKP